MADLGDVADTLVNLISAALYPNGVSAGSPVGVNFRIYRGHPGPDVLESDMQAGFSDAAGAWALQTPSARIVHICVNPRPGVARVVPPYVFAPPSAPTIPAETITATVSGQTVTIGGTVSAGQGVAVAQNGLAAGAVAGSTDTAATLATALAASLVSAGIAGTTASGAVVTLPGTAQVQAGGFVQAVTLQEVRRQIQVYEVTLYVPGRDLRDTVSAALTPVVPSMRRISLADGTAGLLDTVSPIEVDDDKPEKALLFIRKLYYGVEFPTMLPTNAATVSIIIDNISDFFGDTIATITES